MNLSPLDVGVVCAYIMLVFSIAVYANIFMKRVSLGRKRQKGITAIENHYLAGKTLSFWEISLSTLAAEFSALAFIAIPSYVYFENLNYIKFVIGACISRLIISQYFLPHIYGKGLTIFEVISQGLNPEDVSTKEQRQGRRTFAAIYLVTKVIGVSLKLLGGATLISYFFDISLFVAIMIISMMTYLYIILGGLKAVVRTDMLQAVVFVSGAIAAHFLIGRMTDTSWIELAHYGWINGKFNPLTTSGVISFIFGILAGLAYDAATHGVDQDLTQKLMGAKDMQTAKKALRFTAILSLLVNILFLTLGVIIWSYFTKNGVELPNISKTFIYIIENHFPSPMKGLMLASILAACMSTLDSSINALSAVFWNDLMGEKKAKFFKIYINLDNFIITISVVIVAYIFSLLPQEINKFGSYFAYLSTAPLLALFLGRFILARWIKFNFSALLVFMSFVIAFLGISLTHFRIGLNPQLSILSGIASAFFCLWIFSKVVSFLSPQKVDNET